LRGPQRKATFLFNFLIYFSTFNKVDLRVKLFLEGTFMYSFNYFMVIIETKEESINHER
jgi:hypothetical protein